jgi:hypothetical protein
MAITSQYTIVDTAFIDRSRENNPSAYKHVVFREAGKHWKEGDIGTVMRSLARSPLLKLGCFGTAFSYPDMDEGRTKVVYYDRKNIGALQSSVFVRNLVLEMPLPKTLAKPAVNPRILYHEAEIADFDQMVLMGEGLPFYGEEWHPRKAFGIFKK